MIEKIINDVIARLDGKISSDDIIKVKNILSITLNDYEFTSKSRTLSCVVIPECLNIYLATKKIEGKSEKTIALYKLYLNEFIRTIQKPLENVVANDIRKQMELRLITKIIRSLIAMKTLCDGKFVEFIIQKK